MLDVSTSVMLQIDKCKVYKLSNFDMAIYGNSEVTDTDRKGKLQVKTFSYRRNGDGKKKLDRPIIHIISG